MDYSMIKLSSTQREMVKRRLYYLLRISYRCSDILNSDLFKACLKRRLGPNKRRNLEDFRMWFLDAMNYSLEEEDVIDMFFGRVNVDAEHLEDLFEGQDLAVSSKTANILGLYDFYNGDEEILLISARKVFRSLSNIEISTLRAIDEKLLEQIIMFF